MAKPTASESGTKSAWAAPCMKNDGRNTARMQSIASNRGTAVSMFPSRTAEAIDAVPCILWWMFSISTVASSTRMPTAMRQSAQRHEVDRLPREPERHQSAADRERDVEHHDDHAAPVAQKHEHHQPGQDGAERALDRQAVAQRS